MTVALRACETCGGPITGAHVVNPKNRKRAIERNRYCGTVCAAGPAAVYTMRVPERTSIVYCMSCGMTPPHHWAGCDAR